MPNWAELLAEDNGAVDQFLSGPGSLSETMRALSELRNEPVRGPGLPAPETFESLKARIGYNDLPVAQQQRAYDDWTRTQLPRFTGRTLTEDEQNQLVADFAARVPRPKEKGIFETIGERFMRGTEVQGAGLATAALGAGVISPEKAAKEIADIGQGGGDERAFQREFSSALDRFRDADGFAHSSAAVIDTLGVLLGNPKQLVGEVAQSLGSSVQAISGAAIGSVAGGPVGAMIGLLAGNTASNVQASIAERIMGALTEAGVDLQDQAAVAAALKANPQWVSSALEKGGKAGVATAAVESAVDIATFGAGRVLRPAKSLVGKATRFGGAVVAQGGAEGAGVVAGQLAAGETVDTGQALGEGLVALLGGGIVDAAVSLGGGSASRGQDEGDGTGAKAPNVEVVEDDAAPAAPLLALPAPSGPVLYGTQSGIIGEDGRLVSQAEAERRNAPQPADRPPVLALPAPGQAPLYASATGQVGTDPNEVSLAALLARYEQESGNGGPGDGSGGTAGGSGGGVSPAESSTATGVSPGAGQADAGTGQLIEPDDAEISAIAARIDARATGAVPANGAAAAGAGATGQPGRQGGGRAGGDQASGGAGSNQPAAGRRDPNGGAGGRDSGRLILQNRDRKSPASVAQMTAIAANPDYLRLSPGRSLSEGAPVVIDEASVEPNQVGKSDQAVDAQGNRVPIRYAVVEADKVLSSHTVEGYSTGGYVNGQEGSFRAVAGNGRIAGLQAAFERGNANAYVEALAADSAAHGVDAGVIRGMRRPVLVRLMDSADVTADIGDRTNTTGVSALSPVEQAANDANRVRLEGLEFADDGTPTPNAVRRFVQGMPASEQPGMLDAQGQPSRQAYDRLLAAVFQRAYGDAELVNLFAASTDPEARNVLSVLAQIAPAAVRLEGAAELDVRPVLVEAAKMAVNARRRGVALSQLVQQVDIGVDADVASVAGIIAEHSRSVRRMGERLGELVNLAVREHERGDKDIFGAVEKPSIAALIELSDRPEATPFSRKPGEPGGIDPNKVGDAVRRLVTRWKDAPPIVVVPRLEHSRVPADVRRAAALGDGAPEGFFYQGKVYLIADQLDTPADVLRVTMHESLGHWGLARTFGRRMQTILARLARERRAEVERLTRAEGLDPAVPAQLMVGAEELLAYLAQTAPTTSAVRRATSAVKDWIRTVSARLGRDGPKYSDADIVNRIIAPARRRVIDGRGGIGPFYGQEQRTPRFSRRASREGLAKLAPDQARKLADLRRTAHEVKPAFDEVVRAIANEVDGDPMLAPIKGIPRSSAKIATDYQGQTEQIKDLVRATVMVDAVEDAQGAVDVILREFDVLPTGRRNLFAPGVEVPDGYRDAKFNVQLTDGLVGEVQVNIPEMLEAKSGPGHALYEEREAIDRKAKDEGRGKTEDESRRVDELNAQMTEIYGAALQAALARTESTRAANSASPTRLPSSRTNPTVRSENGRGGETSQAARIRAVSSSEANPRTPPTDTGKPPRSYSSPDNDISSTSRPIVRPPGARYSRRSSGNVNSSRGADDPRAMVSLGEKQPFFSRRTRKDADVTAAAQQQGFQADLFGPTGEVSADAAARTRPGNVEPAAAVPRRFDPLAPDPALPAFTVLRRVADLAVPDYPIASSVDAAQVFAHLRRSPREHLQVLVLNDERRPIGFFRLFSGTINSASFDFREALVNLGQLRGARHVWIAHNHPSGTTAPSDADRTLTRAVAERLASAQGAELAGHIIIAGQRFTELDTQGGAVTGTRGQRIAPARRNARVPILERVIIRHGATDHQLKNSSQTKKLVGDLLPESGVLLADNQNRVRATLPISHEDAGKPLSENPALRETLRRAMGQTNTNNVVVVGPDLTWTRNLAAALYQMGDANVLDAIVRSPAGDPMVSLPETLTETFPPNRQFFSRRRVREADDPRNTETFRSNQDLLRFSETLNLPPRTLADVAIRERKPARAAKLYANEVVGRLVEGFADQLRPMVRWIEALPVAEPLQRAILGGIRRAANVKSGIESEASERFGVPMRKALRALAKKHGIGADEALQAVGNWATANYVPQQNQWLADKDQMAIGEAQQEVSDVQAEIAKRGQSPALLEALKVAQGNLDAARGKAAIRLREINDPRLTRADFEVGVAGGLTNAQAAKIKANIEAKIPEAEIRAVAKHVWDMLAWKLQKDIQSGKVDQATVNQWPNHPEYVPTTGDPREVDFEDLLSGAPGGTNLNTPRERAVGGRSSSVAQDGITAAWQAVARSAHFAGHQDFKVALNAAYESMVAERVGQGMTDAEAIRSVAEDSGLRRLPGGTPGLNQADTIRHRVNDKEYAFVITDQRAMEALRRENMDRVPGLVARWVAPFTRVYARLVTTWNPAFAPINSIRDIWERTEILRTRRILDDQGNEIDTAAVARRAMRFMYSPTDVATTFKHAFGRQDTSAAGADLRELMELGGISTWNSYLAKTREQLSDQLRKDVRWGKLGDAADGVGKFVMAYNQAQDTLSSLAVYRALLEAGVAKKEAAAQALDLMDFRKTGSLMLPVKALWLFAQPTITGGYNLGKSLTTRTGQRRLMAYTLLGMMLYSVLRMLDEDNDDEGGNRLDQLGSWTTERTIPIPVGDSVVKLPIGFGAPMLAWGVAQHLTRLMAGESTPGEAAVELLKQLGKQVSPLQPSEIKISQYPVAYFAHMVAPTMIKPLVEVATDRNVFGQKITPAYPLRDQLRSEQAKVSTPPEYRELAVWMQRNMGFDLYPETLRTIVRGYAVGPFRELFLRPFIDNPQLERMGKETAPSYVRSFVAPFNQLAVYIRAREAYDELQTLNAERESRADRGEDVQGWLTTERRRKLALWTQWKKAEQDIRNEKARATRAFNSGKISEARKDTLHELASKRREREQAEFLYRFRTIEGRPTTRKTVGGVP